jgi:uncharacterized protein DUF3515
MISAAPDTVLGKNRDPVDGPGAASWGDTSIVLRCGVTPPPPTPNLCMNVDGVDWVLNKKRDMHDERVALTTYGRVPAVELTVARAVGHHGGALTTVNHLLDAVPQARKCTSLADVP